jgi:O-antigen/teichoic acid export membrane protein
MDAPGSVTDRSSLGIGLVWRGATSRGLATLLAKGASFLTTIYLVRHLPPASSGSFLLALAAAATLGPLVSFGMAENLARIVPALDVEGRRTESCTTTRAALRLVTCTAAVAGGLGTLVALLVAPSGVGWVVSVAAFAGLLALDAVAAAFLRARRHPVLAESLLAAAPVVFFAALVVATRHGTPDASDAFLLRTGLELAATGLLVGVVLAMTRPSRAGRLGRSLLGSSFPFWVAGLVWLAIQNADVLILGLVRGPEAVAGYVPILRTADLALAVQGLFAVYVLPTAAAYHSAGRSNDLEWMYVRATTMALVVSAPLLGVLAVAPETLGEALLGTAAPDTAAVARLLAAAYAVNAFLCLGGVVLQGIGDVWELARRWGLVLAVTIAIDLILIPALGVVGAAMGTLLALVGLNATSWYLLRTRHGITPLHRPLVVPMIATGAAIGLLTLVHGGDDALWLLVVAVVTGMTAGAAALVATPGRKRLPSGRAATPDHARGEHP